MAGQTVASQQIDQAKVEAFTGRVVGILNDSYLGLMLSIGHQTSLLDAMAELPPSTSHEIAEAAGLNERYVREWLAAMVTGGIVEYDSSRSTYLLPPEHAASVTRRAGPDNLTKMMAALPQLGTIEDELIEAFRNGGGVPYSSFAKFQEMASEWSHPVFDATLVDVVLPLVPGLVKQLDSGIDACDVGCGSGHAINLMATAFPKSRFVGYDFSEEGIAAGTAEAASTGLSNARFEVKDAATLDGSNQFDLITVFDAIHDQAQPTRVLKRIYDSLRPGGWFLCVDIAASSNLHENLEHPLAPMLYSISTMHCMTVSLALDGEGLGTMWGEQKAREMMNDAGFRDVKVERVEGDILNNYYICQKGDSA